MERSGIGSGRDQTTHAGGELSDQWAAPGSRAEQPSVAAPRSFFRSAPSSPGVGDPDVMPRPLPLRPQSVLEILDSGFSLIRARPGLLLGLVAVLQVPVTVVVAYLRRDSVGFDSQFIFSDPAVTSGPLSGRIDSALVGIISGSVIQALSAVAIGGLVAAWYADRDPDVTELLLGVGRRIHVVLIAWFLVHVLEILAVLGLLIGSFFVAVLMLVVAPIVAVEQAGPITAIRRSVHLVRGRFVSAMVFFVFSGLVATTLGAVLGGLPTLVGLIIGVNGGWILVALGGVISGVVSTSFLAAATVAFYLDLRIRREGIDIQLAMVDRFPK